MTEIKGYKDCSRSFLFLGEYFHRYKYKSTISVYRDSDYEPSSDVQDKAEVSSDLQSVSSVNSDTETSKDDQQAEDSDLDSDCLVFTISLEAADDICVKLDQLVKKWNIT